jgi:OOP family OmpA-OmpF porin
VIIFRRWPVGDFPADWNTNSGGEVVTAEGKEGHWLMLSQKKEYFIPDYITELPENFTMQFESDLQ